MSTERTLEQRLKFDSGLTIGNHVVTFTMGERSIAALVRIGARGAVYLLQKPGQGDMYASWARVTGDNTKPMGDVYLWPATRCPELMAQFDAPVAATLELTRRN